MYKRRKIFYNYFIFTLLLIICSLGNSKVVHADELVTDVVDIAAHYGHTMVLKSDGTVWTWGNNYCGQLGNGSTSNSLKPVQVTELTGLTDIKEIAGGNTFSLALSHDGTVWAWGCNTSGQLGDGTTTRKSRPVEVLTGVQHITKSGNHVIVLMSDGRVYTWGENSWGQLGHGVKEINGLEPMQVRGLTNVIEVAAGHGHSMALKDDGTVWAWGMNHHGQVGQEGGGQILTPMQVPELTNIIKIAAGGYFSMALKDDGTVWTWGINNQGQLGHGKYEAYPPHPIPTQVNGISDVKEIAGGYDHSIALKNDGTVYAWGCNYLGQLGQGDMGSASISPVEVKGLQNIKKITIGGDHSIALQNDGTVWSWGQNSWGQLGNQTKIVESKPVKVLGLDLPKPKKLDVYLDTNLPSTNVQFKIILVMDDNSTSDITKDENTSYKISNSELATINNQGFVSLVPYSEEDDFSITVSYKDLDVSTVSYHVRNNLVGDKLIYGDDYKGIYHINRKSTYSKNLSNSVIDSWRNIILSAFPGASEALTLIDALKEMENAMWEDVNWQIKVPAYAIGDSFSLYDGNNYNNYSSFYWTSIETVNNNKAETFYYILEGGGKIIYITSEGDKLTINNCIGGYMPQNN